MKIISLGSDIEQRSLKFSALVHFCVSTNIAPTFSLSPTRESRHEAVTVYTDHQPVHNFETPRTSSLPSHIVFLG